MIEIKSSLAESELHKTAKKYGKQAVNSALMMSTNRTLERANTQASRLVRERYTISLANLKKEIKLKKANQSNLTAELLATANRVNIMRFKARIMPKKGLRVEIVKGQSKVIKSAFGIKKLPGAAFARGTDDGRNLTWRDKRIVKKGADMPIASIKSPSAFVQILNDNNRRKLSDFSYDVYNREVIRQLARLR